VVIVSAILIGLGAGPLWVSQSFYISECATDQNKGRFNGIFFSIFTTSNIVSNILASFLLEKFSKIVFYFVMSSIGFFASIFLLFLKKPSPIVNDNLNEIQINELNKIKPLDTNEDN
jgi:MFS family permease